jgi:hypothetical protein
VDELFGDGRNTGENGTETESGEDVLWEGRAKSAEATERKEGEKGKKTNHVVSLTGTVSLALVRDVVERRTSGKEDLSVGTLNSLLERTLGLSNGVREGEDNGALVVLRHEAEDLLGEGSADGRETEEGGGLDVLDDFLEGLELRNVVGTGEVLLVLGEGVTTVVGNETLEGEKGKRDGKA